ncbi:hypothetical protein BCR36DRAFT_352650 [Piromyces finnis]|uniref:Uncharacterized protein n=1 Tax=Piromyces finnis TaxID=1754191 RepID=A0A1Y1V9I0_9FUNG|nr:hypothetical protein BCR36DRAFT_352650 [Piromyces finnis]|eukprot:ORX50401.1 hypothetical protein BCR36DRAFT_352650 [Piromyces finnis]
MSTMSINTDNTINNLNNNMEIVETQPSPTRKIASPQKASHRRSKSFDINALNKTFSKLNVQSNKKSEKRGIDKINEIILGNNEYYIPERPTLNINTKSLARMQTNNNGFKTPTSAVDYNELLKSLDDLTSEVKSNTIKRAKHEEKRNNIDEVKNISTKTDENNSSKTDDNNIKKEGESDEEKPNEPIKPTLKHSGSFRYLLSLRKKTSNESLKDGEENNMPCFTDILQTSKNYIFNLAKKTQENNEETNITKIEEEEKKPAEITENKEIDKKEVIKIPEIKITENRRKSSEATIYKSDNDQCESTRKQESIEEDDDSFVNHGSDNSVINLYSKNRDSINLDVYMNSELFPKTPITPITPENKLDVINEGKEEEEEKKLNIEKEKLDKELKDRKKFESLALPKLPPNNYGHKKSKSEVIKLPIDKIKERSQIRRTYSKDNLDNLKDQDVEASYEILSNNKFTNDNEVERNPVRHDSIRYSNSHSVNLQDNFGNKRKSFLNHKNNNSNYLRKKQSGNRLSVNRSSINFQDINNVKDLTKPFYVKNKNFETTKATDEKGKDVYFIRRLNNINNEEETDNSSSIKLYRNTRKLSDVTSKRQRSDSTSSNFSNRSLPVMNNNKRPVQYDKFTLSPNLMKSSVPVNKSSLSRQSLSADDEDFETGKVLLSALPHEEDTLNLMTCDIERDKNIEKMMNNLEAIKNSISGEKEKSKEEGHFKPSWAKNSSSKHNSLSSNDLKTSNSEDKRTPNLENNKTPIVDNKKTPNLEDKKTPIMDNKGTPNLGTMKTPKMMEENISTENNYYVASPQRRQYQSGGLIFSKRNSSLTRFSVVSARTRHSVAQPSDVALKSKYYRYSVARNMNTYNNQNNMPIPSHHTKLCIPHFDPNSLSHQQPPQATQSTNRKDSIDSLGSQETLTMEGSLYNNRVDSSIYSNDNSRSFLFRDTRDSKVHNISNIISEIKEEEDEYIEEPPLEFDFKNENKSNDRINYQNQNNISFIQAKNNNSSENENKAEIVSKINVSEIPFLYNKEQANWETNMHTMSLYNDQNPKPKKNKKGFRKTFSIFKKSSRK